MVKLKIKNFKSGLLGVKDTGGVGGQKYIYILFNLALS